MEPSWPCVPVASQPSLGARAFRDARSVRVLRLWNPVGVWPDIKSTLTSDLSIYSSVLTQSSTHERGGAAPSPTLNFLILYCTHTLFLFVVRLANKHCSVLVVKINSKTEQMPRDLPASGPNHHPQAIFCNCSELQELATTIAQPRIRTFLPFSARQPVSFCHCSTQHVVSDMPPGLAVNMMRSMIGSSFPS